MGEENQLGFALLWKQYFQLLEPGKLAFPSSKALVHPVVQANIYATMFDEKNLQHPPPPNYQVRVLKALLNRLEEAITDPDEEEISDDILTSLTTLLAYPPHSAVETAQMKSYVTYFLPSSSAGAHKSITTYEARGLLSSSGTTGFRTWEAALHLGSYLASEEGRGIIKNKKILELGAGTGFLSLLCVKHLGCRLVLATDGDATVVEDIQTNIFLNSLTDPARMEASEYKWGHAISNGSLPFHDDIFEFDVVLGADITYDVQSIPPLVSTLRDLFVEYPGIEAIISATLRNPKTLDAFLDACAANEFIVREIEFQCPPIESQNGFFHSTDPAIIIISLKRPVQQRDPFAL